MNEMYDFKINFELEFMHLINPMRQICNFS